MVIIMTNEEMLKISMKQSAEDIGCKIDDFLNDENVYGNMFR